MSKGLWILVILLSIGARAYSQQENVWAFGTASGLDFNGSSPMAMPTGITGFGEASASVCDNSGQLLFYSNGVKVWDRNGNLMPNGNDLINDPGLAPLPAIAVDFTSSTTQGALIVPVPGNTQKYYLFSMTCAEMGISNNGMGRLYYSIVDMQQNGGLGDIQAGQKGVLVDSGLTEHMAGVTGDHCNIWVLTISRLQNTLRAYNITESGVNANPVISPLLPVNYYIPLGSITASSDRKTVAIGRSGVGLYDFDPATGTATGKVALAGAYSVASGAYNVCFSPDDSKLYVSFVPLPVGNYASFQFDLSSGDSLTMVNSAVVMNNPISISFKKAANGKIYTTSGGNALNVINYPDLPVPACQFIAGALPVTGNIGLGLPNTVPVFVTDTMTGHSAFKAGCFAAALNLHALNDSTGWDYNWSTGATGPLCSVEMPGTYWVTYKSAPCIYHTDTIIAMFPDGAAPHLFIEANCKGDTNGYTYVYTYPGDTINYIYEWKDNNGTLLSVTDSLKPASTGNYSLHIHSANCDTTLLFYIPELEFHVSFTADSFYCQGDSLSFQNTSENYFTHYLWHFGDGSSSTEPNPVHPYNMPGTYSVILTGSGQRCKDTASHTITVDTPAAAFFTTDRDSICTGESVTFYPAQAMESITWFNWQSGANFSLSAPPDSFFRFAFDRPGNHPVTLNVRARACPDTAYTDTVYVYPLPLVNLGPDTVLCLNGNPILLRNAASSAVNSSYSWNTGDTSATIYARSPGTYRFTIALAPLGCSNTDEVIVDKGCYIDIPNAFTPNEDGTNDYFFPRQLLSRHLTRFRMQLFNRWGQVIFETTNTEGRGWDGKFNGSPQPEGIYMYLIDVEIDTYLKEHYQGNVTLLR
jgi:gliding motility-associated-like protein